MKRGKGSLRSWLGMGIAVVAAVVLGCGIAGADEEVKVTLSCPSVISPGGTLTLGLTLKNITWPAASVTIAKSAIAVHLANLNILGPFVIPLSRTLVYNETASYPNYLTVPFPSAPSGTFSSLGVAVMNSANIPIGGDGCIIEVQ